MPNYHFNLKTDKRPDGGQTKAYTHCEYIERTGRFADIEVEELENLSCNNLITGKHPIENLPESELLLYSSPYGKIVVDKTGLRLMRQSTLSEETIALGIEIARRIYGDELELKGKSSFKKKAMATAVKLEVPVNWQDVYQNRVMAIMKEEYENDRKEFEAAGGKYLHRRIADHRKSGGKSGSEINHSEPHAELDTLEALAQRGFSLPHLPQCRLVRPEGRGKLLLSRDEDNHLLNQCREHASHLRWYSLRARRRAIEQTVNDIMMNFQKSNDAVYASSHVQYINRESIFKKRGGCLYTDNHLPKWAEGGAQKFFQAADRYERANGERYKEIEFSLPSELPLPEQKKMVEDFLQMHLQDFYYAYAIHDKIGAMSNGERHPHVHIMFSPRQIDETERRQERSPEVFFSRANSKNPAQGGCKKAAKWNCADRRQYLLQLREDYARIQNEALARNGINLRVDHRSFKAQRAEALAEGNYMMAELLHRLPEEYVGPTEMMNPHSEKMLAQKRLRKVNHLREKNILSRVILQDRLDKAEIETASQELQARQEEVFDYEHDIEDEEERACFEEEKQEILSLDKEVAVKSGIVLWAPQAIEQALLDAMTTEEKELWQDLKCYGREKKEWEVLKKSLIEPPSDDFEALAAYRKICPEIDKELAKLALQISQTAADLRPVFARMNLPHAKASIRKQAALYLNDNRNVKYEIKRIQRKMDTKLKELDRHLKEYFDASQKNRDFSLEEIADILGSNIVWQEAMEKQLRAELQRMQKRVISYSRAIAMAKNNYLKGALKKLRADKRTLKKQEDKLSPADRQKAWQEIERREKYLEVRCSTSTAKAKIEAIAAGILRKNAPVAKAYNKLADKHAMLKDAIAEAKYHSRRVQARAPLEHGNRFRTAEPTSGGGGRCPTPTRSADLISKAIDGSPKEAQLVARAKADEPDEWKWLSEADKDDLRNDMRSIDRY